MNVGKNGYILSHFFHKLIRSPWCQLQPLSQVPNKVLRQFVYRRYVYGHFNISST
jgi:hypothetical protein